MNNFLLDIDRQSGIITCIDFGHGEGIAVKLVGKKRDDGSLRILSCECIGLSKDFDTEEKINKYIEKL